MKRCLARRGATTYSSTVNSCFAGFVGGVNFSERRGNRAESYGDAVRQGGLPKTLAVSDETVLIRNISVYTADRKH